MARYPVFEEYRKRGNYADGLKRCDELLSRSPNDVQLLTVKLQLLYATEGDAQAVLEQLASLPSPPRDLRDITVIEDAVENSHRDVYPPLNTTGATLAKIWENASKASTAMNQKLDLWSLRFSRALIDNRLLDAQQAIIQLKALQPRNRILYMAHLAVTQLLSTSFDDLQARLALSLARKAVKENFDEDRSLDCRVPGQIFALQKSYQDLESIIERPFKESKLVYDALRLRKGTNAARNGSNENSKPDSPIQKPPESLPAALDSLKQQFGESIASSRDLDPVIDFASTAIRLFHKTHASESTPRRRDLADCCFLSVSSLVEAFDLSQDLIHLYHAAFLVETLLQLNRHVHEARLVLVYLYMRLGLGSLAMRMFDSLNVKEIQHDTVGHALFTRLSITHPHLAKWDKRGAMEPQKRLTHTLAGYVRHEEKLAETEASVLNHEQTGMLFDLRDLRNALRTSLARRIAYIEQRRIARLLQSPPMDDPTQLGPRVLANWLAVTDSRDFAATFDFGYNVEKALYGGLVSVAAARRWMLYALAIDCASCMVSSSSTPVKDVQRVIEEIDSVSTDLQQLNIEGNHAGTVSDGVTHAERLAGEAARQLLEILLRPSSIANHAVESLKKHVDAIINATQKLDQSEGVSVIVADALRDSHIYLDIMRVTAKACQYASGKTESKETQGMLVNVQQEAEKCCSTLLRHAQKSVKSIDNAAVQLHLEESGHLIDSVKLFGRQDFAYFCSLIATSAKEGWEGVVRVASS